MGLFDIDVQERALSGKSAIRNLKREGMIPGVLYSNDKSIPIALNRDDLRDIINKFGENVLLNVNYKGEVLGTKIQEIQRHPVNHEIINHIDLMPVDIGNDKSYLH